MMAESIETDMNNSKSSSACGKLTHEPASAAVDLCSSTQGEHDLRDGDSKKLHSNETVISKPVQIPSVLCAGDSEIIPGDKTAESSSFSKMDCNTDTSSSYLGNNTMTQNDSGIEIGKSPATSNQSDSSSMLLNNPVALSKSSLDPMDDSVLEVTGSNASTPLSFPDVPCIDEADHDENLPLESLPADSVSSVGSPEVKPQTGNETPIPNNEVSDDSFPEIPVRRDSDTFHDDDDDNHDDVSDSESDIDEDENIADTTKSDESDSDIMDTESKLPKDTWLQLQEIRRREMGFRSHVQHASMFRSRACASLNLTMRLKKFTTLEYHDGCVNALHFNKSGTLLSSGSDDLEIVVWDWAKEAKLFHFESGHRSNVFQCKFMPYTGDCHMVSCARDGQVRLAELSSMAECKSTRKLAQHKGAAHKLALLEDSSHIFYSCGEDGAIFEIDLRQEKPNKLCIAKEGSNKIALYSIHANPFKSQEFCVGGRDHYLRIYDKRMMGDANSENQTVKKFYPHHLSNNDIKANVTCAVFSHDGSEVVASYNDEDIYLFDNNHSDGADAIHKYSGHRNNATVKGVNMYGPRSEYIVSGSDCGNVFLWHKETEEIVNYFHGDEGGVVNVLEPHPHCPVLATSGLDHDVKIWAPLREEPNQLEKLRQPTKVVLKVMRRNKRERDEERSHEPDMDSQMFWFLMQNLRRTARRRAREEGEDLTSSSESDSDSDDDSSGQPRVSCTQS